MPILNDDFSPASHFLKSCHVQTLLPTLMRHYPNPQCRRERFLTSDQDFLDIDWFGPKEGAAPIVILCHGLTGSSRSPYIRGMQSALAGMGLTSCALNFRGCSSEPNLTAKAYHSGETQDIHEIYRWIRQRYPQTPLMVIGYSLGGSVVLNWLGQQGDQLDLVAAAAVSVPLRLDVCADRLDKGLSRLYRNRLLAELREYMRCKKHFLRQAGHAVEFTKLESLGDLSGIRSFWDYDTRVVARLYGFQDAEDYYRRCSARQWLNAIKIPTLLVQSCDDPFMTEAVLPDPRELSEQVHLLVTRWGGHVGFVEKFGQSSHGYWLERRIPNFFLHEMSHWRASSASAIA